MELELILGGLVVVLLGLNVFAFRCARAAHRKLNASKAVFQSALRLHDTYVGGPAR
jgi:hypothetical protein